MSSVTGLILYYYVEGLRVVDTSVTPFVLNCHVQTVAYLVDELAAEKLIKEYGFDS